jgi:pyruvate-formate lyase-activating enzyme
MENKDIFAPHPKYGEPPLDTYFVERIQEIVKEYGITTIVETGVHWGNSTVIDYTIISK